MGWDQEYFAALQTPVRIAIKRRKFGKFIGLRGCETPVTETDARIHLIEDRILEDIESDKNGLGAKKV